MVEKFTRESFLKDSLDLKSPDLFNWDMLIVSSIFNEEVKADESEKEVIKGYGNAVNCLASAINNQNHPNAGVLAFRCDSLTVPFIFLVRHTVELILKYLRSMLRVQSPNKHGLLSLWDEIEKIALEQNNSVKDALDGIKVFISALEEIDPDGSHARYSKDVKGKLYHEKPKFIRVQMFNNFLQKVMLPLVDCEFV